MLPILMAGFSRETAQQLERELAGIRVEAAPDGRSAVEALERGGWALLVLDQGLSDPGPINWLERLRARPELAQVPIFACLKSWDKDTASWLVTNFGVAQLLFQPFDLQELRRQIAATLNLPLVAPAPEAARAPVALAMADLWERFKDATLKRVSLLEDATRALLQGELPDEMRKQAEREAHKLHGSLGTFGFVEGARIARELDALFRPGRALGRSEALLLSEMLVALRAELERKGPAPSRKADESPAPTPSGERVLVVDDDTHLGEQLALEANRRGLIAECVTNLAAARASLERMRPQAVVLDLDLADPAGDGRLLLAELAALGPGVPTFVLSGKDALLDRIEVARLGASAFLTKPMPPAMVFDMVQRHLERLREIEEVRVLAVDDDPQILAALEALLVPRGIKVAGLTDPLRFWKSMEEAQPDLLVLDIDMPFLNGIELCRVVRNDARWRDLPVVFLTGNTDAETIQRVFAMGADDYVNKPIVAPELVTRIANRLERSRLLRRLGDTDALTGAASRLRATHLIANFLRLADRQKLPVALAVLDLDHFKQVNDTHGHATGDEVLRKLVRLLGEKLREGDVLARWGGEEFVVAMFGSTKEDCARRLEMLLFELRRESFAAADGKTFNVAFSAGVAQYPEDGPDFQALYVCADAALYQAKSTGRGKVTTQSGKASAG
jgi:diguanylate cyclase (GGDEF)-like protein